jgi:hypothetical protein
MTNEDAMKEAADRLPPEYKARMDKMLQEDPEALSNIVQCAFLAGMQLTMRLLRNRAKDLKEIGENHTSYMPIIRENEVQNCVGIIRLCQVEIGAGRMARPKFSKEELEEMDRIS